MRVSRQSRKSAPSSSPTPRRRFRASGAFIAPAVPSPMPEEFIHRSRCHIFGGLVTFESVWTPGLGSPALEALEGEPEGRLDIGCVAAHGMFCCDGNGRYTITLHGKPATAFLFELIDRLQSSATVPMIDIQEYSA